MAKKKGQGFQSAAGLIRYFDEESDKSIPVSPWLVVGLCIGAAVGFELMRYLVTY